MLQFNALDKSNLGNAKTAGLEKDLGMEGTNDYNILLSIFFVPYVLAAPVLAILGKMYGPSRVLPCMMFTFGTMTLLTVAVYNFGGLVTLRVFLGIAESAFFPLVIYYQTQFYRRGELARRLAIFYAASNIAYAFGGLLAFGCFQITGGAVENWKYLFVIEGSLSMCMAVVAFIFLPRSAVKARFLNDEEKKLAFYRIQVDSSAIVEEPFEFREAVQILKEWTSWLILAIEMCLGIPLQSVSLFLPQIVARLGYSTVKTNLYTVVSVPKFKQQSTKANHLDRLPTLPVRSCCWCSPTLQITPAGDFPSSPWASSSPSAASSSTHPSMSKHACMLRIMPAS